jgi:hypothetical protein
MESHAVGDHEHKIASPGFVDELQALSLTDRHGLFQQDMLARLQTLHGDGVMEMVRKNEQAGIDIIQDLLYVGRDANTVHNVGDSGSACLIDIDSGNQLEAVCENLETTQVGARHAAAADQGKSGSGHGEVDGLLLGPWKTPSGSISVPDGIQTMAVFQPGWNGNK